MIRYKSRFKEEVETYKANNTKLQKFIDLHNLCDVYIIRNENRIKMGDSKYLKNFLKLVNDFYKYVEKNIKDVFNELDIPDIKRKNMMRRVENAMYAIQTSYEKQDDSFPSEAVASYSTLHDLIKMLKDYDN